MKLRRFFISAAIAMAGTNAAAQEWEVISDGVDEKGKYEQSVLFEGNRVWMMIEYEDGQTVTEKVDVECGEGRDTATLGPNEWQQVSYYDTPPGSVGRGIIDRVCEFEE